VHLEASDGARFIDTMLLEMCQASLTLVTFYVLAAFAGRVISGLVACMKCAARAHFY